MKRKHTREYVLKIAEELGLTLDDIIIQVLDYSGLCLYTFQAIEYLQQFNADTIRFILKFNRMF